jgi:hypothetical protein
MKIIIPVLIFISIIFGIVFKTHLGMMPLTGDAVTIQNEVSLNKKQTTFEANIVLNTIILIVVIATLITIGTLIHVLTKKNRYY